MGGVSCPVRTGRCGCAEGRDATRVGGDRGSPLGRPERRGTMVRQGVRDDSRAVAAGRSLRGAEHRRRVRRRGEHPRRRDARPGRPASRARLTRVARPRRRAAPRSSPWSARRARRRRRTFSARSARRSSPTVYPPRAATTRSVFRLPSASSSRRRSVLITEMGMRGLGQIAELCAIARPTLALVTSDRAGASRAGRLGRRRRPRERRGDRRSTDRRDRGRAGRRAGARAPSSADGHRGPAVRPGATRASTGHVAEFPLAGSVAAPRRCRSCSGTSRRTCSGPSSRTTRSACRSSAPQEGASQIRLSRWRGEEIALPGGGFVVNDAYNANPTSMRAALLDLAERARGTPPVAVLGEMAELGDESRAYHRPSR